MLNIPHRHGVIIMLVILSVLSGCAPIEDATETHTPWGLPVPDSFHFEENQGTICFKEIGENHTSGGIFPGGCYSGSCTKPASQRLVLQIDHQNKRLKFAHAFYIEDYSSYFDFQCTEDCGAGYIPFTIDDLEASSYEIWVGEQIIGMIDLPSEPICLEITNQGTSE